MSKKDLQHKNLEDHNDVFADIVNVLGFGGERIVKEEFLNPGPTESIYKARDGEYREQRRDVLKYDTHHGVVFMLLGIENQTTVDHDMVFRVMRYDSAAYKIQENSHKKYPVISLVLYFGTSHWNAPKDIHHAIIEDLPDWKKIVEVVPNYHINLIEVAFLPKEIREQLTSDFRIVADYFYAVRTHTEEEFYYGEEGKRTIKHVEDMIDFLQVFARDSRYGELKEGFNEQIVGKEDVNMCTMLDYAINKGRNEGKSLGIVEGISLERNEGIKTLIEAGQEFGQSYNRTREVVMDKYNLDEVVATEKMNLYWKTN